jgi:S-formylglutathione hydrolase
MSYTVKKEIKCFGGVIKKCTHESATVGTPMVFTVFVPPGAEIAKVPVLYYLSGLTCTDDNFTDKGGAFKFAAEKGLMIVAPDTSPRGAGIAGEDDGWDFGTGTVFFVPAHTPPMVCP